MCLKVQIFLRCEIIGFLIEKLVLGIACVRTYLDRFACVQEGTSIRYLCMGSTRFRTVWAADVPGWASNLSTGRYPACLDRNLTVSQNTSNIFDDRYMLITVITSNIVCYYQLLTANIHLVKDLTASLILVAMHSI